MTKTKPYAVRVLSGAPGEPGTEALAVVHVSSLAAAESFASNASEDGMAAQVFDISVEPARLVSLHVGGAYVVDGVVL